MLLLPVILIYFEVYLVCHIELIYPIPLYCCVMTDMPYALIFTCFTIRTAVVLRYFSVAGYGRRKRHADWSNRYYS